MQAIDRDLNYSFPASVTFTVIPPWYLNGWIAIPSGGVIVALLVFSIVFGFRYYVKRREAQRLEQEKQQLRDKMLSQEQSAREDLENAFRLVKLANTTLRGLAHNLKNKARVIRDFMQSDAISNATKEDVKKMQEISEQMVQNFQGLFEAAGEPQYESFNFISLMNVLIVETIRERSFWETNIQVDKQMENLLIITADAEKLRMAFENLIINACEAMEDEGGVLTIKIAKNDNKVLVEIKDTGKGIPKAHLSDVFNAKYTSKPWGTGLGLWIARQIIEGMHKGRLSLRSQEGIGTTVEVELPIFPSE